MPTVQANGMTLEYETRGEGEPLLLIMGLAGQLSDWPDEFVDLFVEQGFQVTRFDNRDIGLSTQTDWEPPSQSQTARAAITRRPLKGAGYTLKDMADDAAGLLGELGIEAAHVVGVSMGGMIAQELAINYPQNVRSICSIMSNTGDRRRGGMSTSLMKKLARRPPPARETAVADSVSMFRLISGPHFDEDVFRERAEVSVSRSFTPRGVARQTAAIMASPDRTERLATLDLPALVIHGTADPLVKFSGGIATAKSIPGARLLAFPDMGHDLPRSRWNEMRDAIVQNTRRASN